MIWRRRRPADPGLYPQAAIPHQAGPFEVADQPTEQPVKPLEEPPDPLDTQRAARAAMERIRWLTDNPEKMTLEEMRVFLAATRAAVGGVEAFMGEVRELADRVTAARPALEAAPDSREEDDGQRPTCGRSA